MNTSVFKFSFAKTLPILFGAISILASGQAFAASTYNGYLIDRMCEASISHDKKDPIPALSHHTRECALNADCSEAGYSLYSDGKFVDLDTKGNAVAKKFFESTSKKEGHYVAVSGQMKRDLLSVDSIKEASAPPVK